MRFNVQHPNEKKLPRWALIAMAIGICAVLVFVGVRQLPAPTDRRVPVAYSDFVTEVRAGRVDEIRIRKRKITFRTQGGDGRAVVKETIGPVPDQALIGSLKPDDPSMAMPKIYFEK